VIEAGHLNKRFAKEKEVTNKWPGQLRSLLLKTFATIILYLLKKTAKIIFIKAYLKEK